MTGKKILKKIMNDPETVGETDQSARLKKFHKDPGVIMEMRKILKNMKDDLDEDKKNLDQQISILKRQKEIPQHENRYYDQSILKRKPKSFFDHLFAFLRTRKLFKDKYKNDKKISWKIFNFLTSKVIFYPSISVYIYVKNFLILQQYLRPFARKMYRTGWLSKTGEEILTPIEFNLIGELERISYDDTILNFLIYYKQPNIAINKINSFLGYYLSITRDEQTKEKLISAVNKSLKQIIFTNIENKLKIPPIVKKIKELISDTIDDEFLIPLFESIYLDLFTGKRIRNLVNFEDIPDTNYNADNNLYLLMMKRKKDYTSVTSEKLKKIENEINLIQKIIDMTNKTVKTLKGEPLEFIDHLILIYHDSDEKLFKECRSNIALYITDLSNFVHNTYEKMFTNDIEIKIGNDSLNAKLFELDVFSDEFKIIKSENRNISKYIKDRYSFEKLEKRVKSNQDKLFIDSINNMNDAFFGIASKLLTIVDCHNNNIEALEIKAYSPIKLKKINNSTIPYYNENVKSISTIKNKQSFISNKKIKDVIEEMIILSLCFSVKFEYKHRDFMNSWREESLDNKINTMENLHKKLEKLQAGEDIEV